MAAKEPSPAKKGILKLSRQPSESSSKAEDGIKWDEMNILATYHPPGKDYGHMKIDEPDTPYNKYHDPEHDDDDPQSDTEGVEELSPDDVSKRLEKDTLHKRWWEQEGVDEESSEDENEDLTEEERAKKKAFESKRKQHYNEAMFMKRAKQLIAEEFEEDDEEDDKEDEKDDILASTMTEESVQEGQS